MTLCSGFSLGCGSKSLGCHFFSDLPPPLSSQTTQRTRQRETERFKGWQQHRSLEVLSLPLTVLQRGFKGCRERGGGRGRGGGGLSYSLLVFFFSSLCRAGWLADGLVSSKMKMNAVKKFACVNSSSPR